VVPRKVGNLTRNLFTKAGSLRLPRCGMGTSKPSNTEDTGEQEEGKITEETKKSLSGRMAL